MATAADTAVASRLERADWKRTEGDAISEQAAVVPHGRLCQVIQTGDEGMRARYMLLCAIQLTIAGVLRSDDTGSAPMPGMKM